MELAGATWEMVQGEAFWGFSGRAWLLPGPSFLCSPYGTTLGFWAPVGARKLETRKLHASHGNICRLCCCLGQPGRASSRSGIPKRSVSFVEFYSSIVGRGEVQLKRKIWNHIFLVPNERPKGQELLRGQFSLVIKRELGVLWGQIWILVLALPLTCITLGKWLHFSEC